MELQVKVLGCEAVKIYRSVPDKRPRKDYAFLEGGAVQEGLQDTASTARSRGNVNFRSVALPEGRGIAYIGNDFPAPDVEDDCGQVRRPAKGQLV